MVPYYLELIHGNLRVSSMSKSKYGVCRAEYKVRAHEFSVRGTKLPHAKLNEDLVRQIRSNRNGWTAKKWADHLGVHVRTIEAVRSYRNWRHVV